MSHSDTDNGLLIAAPKTNRTFLAMAAVALISFLGTLALFSYIVIHNTQINRDICEAANVNRAAITLLIQQGAQEQIIPGEIRSAESPKQPGQKIIFYVPGNATPERTKRSLALVEPIDCQRSPGG